MQRKFATEPGNLQPLISTTDRDKIFLDKINAIIERNMGDAEFKLDTYAPALGLGRTTFYSKLKSIVGCSPNEYVRLLRMKRAAELLITSDINISEAGYQVGIKIFTSIEKEEIEALIAEHREAPHLRILQKRLAKEVTVMVHSEEDYNAAVDASNILFGNATSEALRKLDEDTLLAVFEGVPQFEISRDALAEGVKAVDLFVDNAAVFASKGEMRKLVQGGGVSLNKEKLAAFDQVITAADLLDEKYLLVQRGKKNYYLLIAK